MTRIHRPTTRTPLHAAFTAAVLSLAVVVVLQKAVVPVTAWGNSNNGYDTSIFGNALERDWVYNSAGIAIQVEGCLWAYWQDKDNDESGCLEESSEDGTTYWYQMSNCRRAQVVFSVYASDSSGSPGCNSGTFKETVSWLTTKERGHFCLLLHTSGVALESVVSPLVVFDSIQFLIPDYSLSSHSL